MQARFYHWTPTKLASRVSVHVTKGSYSNDDLFSFRKQKQLWEAGDLYRKKHGIVGPPKFSVGIYGVSELKRKKSQDNVTGIMRKVDCMEINDPQDTPDFDETKETQGDKLNEIKAQRSRMKSITTVP